jgi:RsiW-degrading membrane proteinase PrsW (M82 family)
MAKVNYPLYFIFGVLPSIIWLFFYLRKDVHPEPKKMVLKVFLWGMIFAFPAAALEIIILKGISKLELPQFFILILNNFLGIALVEELMKYLVVKREVILNPEFDEPLDAMLYMIISALGFAAVENILLLFSLKFGVLWIKIIEVSVVRFLGATFLHAICSASLGFFLALSFFRIRKRNLLLSLGFLIAIFLHGLYNFSIMEIEGDLKFLIPVSILIISTVFVSFSFQRLKKIKSICLSDLIKSRPAGKI